MSKGFDLHVDARRKIELHQRIHCVRCRLENIDQALVRAHFELLTRFLVHVRRTQHRPTINGGGQRNRPGHICTGALRGIHNFLGGLVENSMIVRLEAYTDFVALSHNYSMISVTAPAPTVWPPSRMAKRKPFSRATGVMRVTSQLTLSPGITISTPCGSFTSPVTSVVRK